MGRVSGQFSLLCRAFRPKWKFGSTCSSRASSKFPALRLACCKSSKHHHLKNLNWRNVFHQTAALTASRWLSGTRSILCTRQNILAFGECWAMDSRLNLVKQVIGQPKTRDLVGPSKLTSSDNSECPCRSRGSRRRKRK